MLNNKILYFITFLMAFLSNLVNAENLSQPKVCPDKFQPWCSDIKLKKYYQYYIPNREGEPHSRCSIPT